MSGMYRNRLGKLRWGIQLASGIFFNGYLKGFGTGTIYNGRSKGACVPVLNCYSCPGALGACPIGSLQAVLGQRRIPFYILGSIMLFGIALGRVVCGFLCPFGFLQDMFHRIPSFKIRVPDRLHKALCMVKYGILAIMVVALPLAIAMGKGVAVPFFCKYVCPAGTASGVILVALNPTLRKLMGVLFGWKFLVLIVVLLLAIAIPRPFCRYLCPLGAFYGLYHKISLFSMTLDEASCIQCGKCEQICPMQVDITKKIQSAECIQCGACRNICPTGAIKRSKRVP